MTDISGPFRDTLLDLFQPLAVIPEHTKIFIDIRNYTASMARHLEQLGRNAVADTQQRPIQLFGETAQATAAPTIHVHGPLNVETQARNAEELARAIGDHFRLRRLA